MNEITRDTTERFQVRAQEHPRGRDGGDNCCEVVLVRSPSEIPARYRNYRRMCARAPLIGFAVVAYPATMALVHSWFSDNSVVNVAMLVAFVAGLMLAALGAMTVSPWAGSRLDSVRASFDREREDALVLTGKRGSLDWLDVTRVNASRSQYSTRLGDYLEHLFDGGERSDEVEAHLAKWRAVEDDQVRAEDASMLRERLVDEAALEQWSERAREVCEETDA